MIVSIELGTSVKYLLDPVEKALADTLTQCTAFIVAGIHFFNAGRCFLMHFFLNAEIWVLLRVWRLQGLGIEPWTF